jgi:hypothetical protein
MAETEMERGASFKVDIVYNNGSVEEKLPKIAKARY